jgi:hypothetical protein
VVDHSFTVDADSSVTAETALNCAMFLSGIFYNFHTTSLFGGVVLSLSVRPTNGASTQERLTVGMVLRVSRVTTVRQCDYAVERRGTFLRYFVCPRSYTHGWALAQLEQRGEQRFVQTVVAPTLPHAADVNCVVVSPVLSRSVPYHRGSLSRT